MSRTASLLLTIAGAASIAFGAFAAAPHGTPSGGTGLQIAQATQPQQQPRAPGARDAVPERIQRTPDSPSVPAGPDGMAPPAKPSNPPQAIIGKDLVSADGKTVGEVKKIVGNQVIVSMGGFLGLGAREVALLWNDLALSGAGDRMQLRSAMSQKELEALPRYEDPERARPARDGGNAPGRSGTR